MKERFGEQREEVDERGADTGFDVRNGSGGSRTEGTC